MKIVAIFAVVNKSLLSVQFDKEEIDEFSTVFNNWNDVTYLEAFFEENKEDLQSGFFGDITIENAVFATIEEAARLEERIRATAIGGLTNSDEARLDLLFTPLNKLEGSITLVKTKAYATRKPFWLRLYAIRIAENLYVVTGGAIKLTKTMNERAHLRIELDKLEVAQQYLKESNILEEDDYGYIEISYYD